MGVSGCVSLCGVSLGVCEWTWACGARVLLPAALWIVHGGSSGSSLCLPCGQLVVHPAWHGQLWAGAQQTCAGPCCPLDWPRPSSSVAVALLCTAGWVSAPHVEALPRDGLSQSTSARGLGQARSGLWGELLDGLTGRRPWVAWPGPSGRRAPRAPRSKGRPHCPVGLGAAASSPSLWPPGAWPCCASLPPSPAAPALFPHSVLWVPPSSGGLALSEEVSGAGSRGPV